MANSHMKRCSMFNCIREMQIKTSVRYHLTSHLSDLLSLTNQQTTSIGEDVERGEASCIVGGNADWCSHCGKQYGVTAKKLKNGTGL